VAVVVHPRTYREAAAALADAGEDARVLAGGQSLAIMMRLGLARPPALVSLRDCPGAAAIVACEHGLVLGPRTTMAAAAASAAVRAAAPVLADAASQVASPHVRNFGTVVGNLCQADPGSDLAAPLLCHDAVATARSAAGERRIPVSQFVQGPFQLSLAEGEFVTALSVPPLPGWRGAYRKLVWRSADHPLAGAAAAVDVRDGVIAGARLALGGSVAVSLRLTAVERALEGAPVADAAEVAREAAHEAVTGLRFLNHPDAPSRYLERVSAVLIGDAVTAALNGDWR
jgi:carbon-monoxide dehydrogenase medium subunit